MTMKAGSPCRARPSFFEFRLVQAQDTGHPAGVLQAIHGTVCVNPMAFCPATTGVRCCKATVDCLLLNQ